MDDAFRLPDYAPPLATDLVKPFYEGLAAGELRLPTCPSCNRKYWYPVATMPCHPDMSPAWMRVSPIAIIYSFTRIERSLLPGAKPGSTPYTIVMAEPLDAPGARIIGILVEGDGETADIACGDQVRFQPLAVHDHVIPGFARQ